MWPIVSPHVRPPSIPFDGPITEVLDGETITLDPSDLRRRELCITDTTFRDGQQARMPYTVEQIGALFDLMATLSSIPARCWTGHPKS